MLLTGGFVLPVGIAAAEGAGAAVVVITATHTHPLATPHFGVAGYDALAMAMSPAGLEITSRT